MKHSILWICLVVSCPALADAAGPAIGSVAVFSTIEEGVKGTATILDSHTIKVDHFYYNGGGISVYFRLGTNETTSAFANGISLGDQLVGQSFSDASLFLNVPGSVEGYKAISVYCVAANVNFGSGTFILPPPLLDIERTNGVTSVILSGGIGQPYEFQGSTDLKTWTDLQLLTNMTGTLVFTDTNQVDQRFYRAVVE